MTTEWIIYEGEGYKLEWYYDTKGKSQALEYFEALSDEQKRKAIHLFKVMGDIGKIQNETKFRSEEDGIYAFKPKPDRFLCFFFKGKKIIVTNAFKKKQDKLPKQEKLRALACKADYEARVKEGIYYENGD